MKKALDILQRDGVRETRRYPAHAMTLPFEYWPLKELKKLGHELLNKYISLEHKSWRTGSQAVSHAYEKLAHHVNGGEYHFARMSSKQEVLKANAKLRKMIKSRLRKREMLEEKAQYKDFLPREELQKALKARREN